MPLPSIRIVIAGVDKFSSTIGKAMKGVKRMGETMRNIGRNMTIGLTLPIVTFGAMTLRTAGDFETSMNKVQNLTGATVSEMTALTSQARELGATTAFSASQTAGAMGILGLSGMKTNEILASTADVLNLAAAGSIEMSESADVLTGVMAGFNKKATDATNVADLLVTAMQSSKTDILGVGEAMSFVAPMAKSLGVTVKDTALAIGLLSNANIKGARAGTTFRAILASLAKPTKEAAMTLERLKIDKSVIFDADGKFKGLTETIEAFRNSGANAQDMIAIFGRKMGVGMSAMVGQGKKKLDELNASLNNIGGAAKRAADVQMKGLNGQLKALRSAFEELQLAIADSGLLTFVTKLVTKLADFTRKVAKLNPTFLKWGTIIAGVVAAIGPLLFVLGSVLVVAAKVGAAVSAAGGVIALLSNPIGWVISAIGAMIAIVTLMVKYFNTKFGKILAGMIPVGGIIAWVIKRWKRILPFVKLLVFFIVAYFKLLWRLLKPIVMPIANLFAWLGDLIFKSLDMALTGLEKLTRLALPKWLEDRIGLSGDTAVPAGVGSAAHMQRRIQAVDVATKNESVIRFDGAPPGMVVQSATPGLTIETERGTLMPEGG